MRFAKALISVSAVIFASVGLAYFIAPGPMLSIVGIPSNPTNDFLMRTEGVALASAAIFLLAARGGSRATLATGLMGLAIYYIVGSIVDLAAFMDGVVGAASVPSGIIRVGFGVLCAWAALGLRGT
jgi:hypothetical protein